MKKNKVIWNYIDMFFTSIILLSCICVSYFIANSLEKYLYRYVIFPFIAFLIIFLLGIYLGKSGERTKNKKPVGLISNKMAKLRKEKNAFVFSDDGETYTPKKEIIEDIKSGEIVHIKQIHHSDFETEEFNDIYNIHIEDVIDDEMNKKINNDGEGNL
jgi:hypothetical protein